MFSKFVDIYEIGFFLLCTYLENNAKLSTVQAGLQYVARHRFDQLCFHSPGNRNIHYAKACLITFLNSSAGRTKAIALSALN